MVKIAEYNATISLIQYSAEQLSEQVLFRTGVRIGIGYSQVQYLQIKTTSQVQYLEIKTMSQVQ